MGTTCMKCGGEKPDDRYQMCPECRRKAYEYQHKHKEAIQNREEWERTGRCIKCGGERVGNTQYCAECYAKILKKSGGRNSMAYRYKRQVAEARGMCTKCGVRKPLPGKKQCEYCAMLYRKRRMRYAGGDERYLTMSSREIRRQDKEKKEAEKKDDQD